MSSFFATRNSKFSGEIGDQSAVETTDDRAKLIDSVNSGSASDPKSKFWTAIGFIVSAALVGAVVGGLYVTLPLSYTVPTTTLPSTTSSQSGLLSIGQSCTLSTQCIASSYCDQNSTVCTCSQQFYYDSTTGSCRGRKGFGESCSSSTECEFNMLLLCSSSSCQCDSMLFWNPYTHMCEDKRGLGQSCLGVSNECYSPGMQCLPLNNSLTNRCLCPLNTTYFSFYLGDCATKKTWGAVCYATFECIDNAWCTPFPSGGSSVCNCVPSHYYDSTALACYPKKYYGISCYNAYECIDNMLSLTCLSSGTCGCPTYSNWNGTACNYQKPYLGPCNSTADCLNSGTICDWLSDQAMMACVCPTGTYFSVTSQACINYVALGSICLDSTYCNPNATCLWQNSTADMRCQCTQSQFYQSGTYSCQFLNSINGSCTSTAQCQATQGLFCINSYCQCPSNYFWNGANCQTQIDYYGPSYAQYCQYPFWCKTAMNLTNCINGYCRCSPGAGTYNSGTYRCQ